MKRLFFLFSLVFFFVSCTSNDADIEPEFVISYLTEVPAYSIEKEVIENVYVSFEIKNYYDTFELYTCYQNYLPNGYDSFGTANVHLLDAYILDHNVCYEVDSYISLSRDYNLFLTILSKANNQLGYEKTIILLNGKDYLEFRQ